MAGIQSVSERREELYGSRRLDDVQKLKSVLSESHVLQNGEYNLQMNQEKDGIYKTTASIDFSGQSTDRPVLVGKIGKFQLNTHFELNNGADDTLPHDYQFSTTHNDFVDKEMPRPEVHGEDRTVYWSDMAPRYATDRAMGSTEYNTTFQEKVLESESHPPLFPKIDTCRVKLPIGGQNKIKKYRGVHVNLGNDEETYESETQRAYGDPVEEGGNSLQHMMADAKLITKNMRDMEIASNVFRDGDYNNMTQGSASVFTVDYGRNTGANGITEEDEDLQHPRMPKLVAHCLDTDVRDKFQDGAEGKADHLRAHFILGWNGDKSDSMYTKDYAPGTSLQTMVPAIAAAPPDSQVLANDPDRNAMGKSTMRHMHSEQVFPMAAAVNPEMISASRRNMHRRHGNNVFFTYDKSRHTSDRQESLSHGDYIPAPPTFRSLAPLREPRPQYNYLLTDVALPYPVPKSKLSDNQYNYVGSFMGPQASIERRRAKDEDTTSRRDNTRTTHFIIGYDPQGYRTENASEFLGRPLGDEAVAPAGKNEPLPRFSFDHYGVSANTQDLRPDPLWTMRRDAVPPADRRAAHSLPALPFHTASIMKNDYLPIHSRHMTPSQIMMLRQNAKLEEKPVSSSHLFHTDTRGAQFGSTTSTDFMKPEIVTGRHLIEAR